MSSTTITEPKDAVSTDTDTPPPADAGGQSKEAGSGSALTLPGERSFQLTARLEGLEVTLCDALGDLLNANLEGMRFTKVCPDRLTLTFVILCQ